MTLTVIGVDPGSRDTGIAVTHDRDLIAALTIHNDAPRIDTLHEPYYRAVYRALTNLATTHRHTGPILIAVEDITGPTGYHRGKKSPINPTHTNNASKVMGMTVAAAYSTGVELQIVPPGGNGSAPMGMYPPELITAGERRKPGWQARVGESSTMRHCRSAWDIATTGRRMHQNRAVNA